MWRLTSTKGWCEDQLLALSVDEVAEGERGPEEGHCVNECISPSNVIMMVSH